MVAAPRPQYLVHDVLNGNRACLGSRPAARSDARGRRRVRHLPSLARPDTTPNRIFIFRDKLQILPPSLLPDTPSIHAADHHDSDDTHGSDAIQATIQRRIAGMQERAPKNLHTACIAMLAPVAKVLKEEPCLIARVVKGFYDLDWDWSETVPRSERRGGEDRR
ncbi:protein ecdysoneless [Hordeum vulgare]|nr:protein ecdysoneless [Hordeum vulgare]